MKDLPKFKAGDRVWYLPTRTWHHLENCTFTSDYPFAIQIQDYHRVFLDDGRAHRGDVNPLIFHTEQTLNFEKPKWFPKEGELCYFWDDNNEKMALVREFSHFVENESYPYVTIAYGTFKYCCPITEIPPHLL